MNDGGGSPFKYMAPLTCITILCAILTPLIHRAETPILSPSDVVINGESSDDVFASCNRIVDVLSDDARTRFADIRMEYYVAYGDSTAHERMRGKTVQQIFDEYKPTEIEPIAMGEDDFGVEWKLYRPNKARDETEQP